MSNEVKFGDEFDFKKAWTWAATDVLGFLDNVAKKPSSYGFPNDRQTDLDTLYKAIKRLEPKATPDPLPADAEVRFKQILVNQNEEIAPIEIKWNNKPAKFFTIFDLLGVFLSLKGAAPPNATAKNYYLPLVALYARWCIALSQFRAFWPGVTQITWASKADRRTWDFALGASLGGVPHDKKDDTTIPSFQRTSEHKRHSYIDDILKDGFKSTDSSTAKDLARGKNKLTRISFGNCGETYPFLYILTDLAYKSDSYGIALKVDQTDGKSSYVETNYWGNSKAYLAPCKNCQQLMRWCKLPDFALNQGV